MIDSEYLLKGQDYMKCRKYIYDGLFKTADPQDMRYGALSKRVHLLKCEEGGYELMDEISEEIYNVGKEME